MRPAQYVAAHRPAARRAVAAAGGLLLLAGASACTTGSSPAAQSSAARTGTATAPPPVDTGAPDTPAGTDTGTETGTAPSGGDSGPASDAPGSTAAHAPTSKAPRKVALVITYSGWNTTSRTAEVDAFAPGVLATDATCTLTLTRGTLSRTTTKKAAPGPSSTQCGALTVAGSQLSPGDWRGVVRFTSASATGTSDPVTITVAG